MKIRNLLVPVALLVLAGMAVAQAPAWPMRPVTLISPFPPGGSTDAVARLMAERMRITLGQTVVVENVGGAGGSIAVGRLARAAPDGYNFVIGQWDTLVGNGVVYKLDHDLEKGFEPIGLVSINPQLIIGRKGLAADDLRSLVAWMKANPGKATFVNQNAAAQTAGTLFQQLTGTNMLFVPYKGAGPAIQDMLAGHVDLLVVQAAAALPQVRAGALKAYANMSPARSPVVPGIPTSDEAGVPGLYLSGWFGLWAPKGTPKEVIARLNAAMVAALADPGLQQKFSDLGLDVAPRQHQSPEGLAAFHKAEIDKWYPIMKAAGIKAE